MFAVDGNRLIPRSSDVQVGGYGRDDIVVYKGAPVAIAAVEKRLKEMGYDAKLRNENGVLVVEGVDAAKAAEVLEEMLRSAERDIEEFERVVNEAIDSYMKKYGK
ncbi:MAG: hypothetical protein ABWW66_03075 [Archaeoglobaceae archaeon]